MRLRKLMGTVSLVLLWLPILAACGAEPQATTSTATPGSTTTAIAATTSAPTTERTTAPATATPQPATAAPATATTEATTPPVAVTDEPSTAVPAETATTLATSPAATGQLEYGVVTHLYYTDRNRVLDLAGFANFDWIRQQVPWKDTEKADGTCGCEELDQIIAATSGKNKKLLLSIVKAPEFATGRPGDDGLPQDPAAFARFASLLLNRYKGKIHAIEVWNEQNLAVENGGNVRVADAGRYVEMLKVAYTAIKAIDPAVIVVAGGLTSTGVTEPAIAVDDLVYLEAMYAYNNGEVKQYFDVQGFHPSNTLHSPDEKYDPTLTDNRGWSDHPTHYFRHIEDVRAVMEKSGFGDKKVWITEMGWATANNTPGYEYGNEISLELQGEYFEGALRRIKDDYPYVSVAFIWNLNFSVGWGEQGNPLHEQAAFSLLNPDYSPRPAFSRIQGFIANNR